MSEEGKPMCSYSAALHHIKDNPVVVLLFPVKTLDTCFGCCTSVTFIWAASQDCFPATLNGRYISPFPNLV